MSIACEFVAEILGRELLGSINAHQPELADDYWAEKFSVPATIASDVEKYLTSSCPEPLWHAASWVVRNYFLSESRPKHHVALVRVLFEQGLLEVRELPSLLALTSLGEQLDEGVKDIAWISWQMVQEGRLDEGGDIIAPMLLAYSPSI